MHAIVPTIIIGLLLIFSGCVSNANTPAPTRENTPITPPVTPPVVDNPVTPPVTPPAAPPLETSETFTLAQIAPHNTANDCWTAIEGKVYDISEFTSSHPGGPGIVGACGIDGTTLFTTRNGNGPHPARAEDTLAKYYIGDLV